MWGSNLSSISAFSSTSTLTSGAHNNCSFAYYAWFASGWGSGSASFQSLRKSLSAAKRVSNGPCAVLLSIERNVMRQFFGTFCPLYGEEVDPCGLFQDIEAN